MAAQTPVAKGTAGWMDPSGSTARWVNGAYKVIPNDNPKRSTYYFSDLDTADAWTISNWHGAVPHVEVIPEANTYIMSAFAALSGTTLTVTLAGAAANNTGAVALIQV